MVPFAQACRAAGHDVVVAAPRSFEPAVVAAGLAFAPLGEPSPAELGAIFGRLEGLTLDEANVIVLREVFAGVDARAALPALSALVDRWAPDVILRELAEFASFVVAESRRIPQINVAIGLESFDAFAYPLLDEPLERLGVTGGPDALSALPRVSLAPHSLEDPKVRLSARTDRYCDPALTEMGDEQLPDWWEADGDPLVYVSFGSTVGTGGMFPDLYRSVALAVADLPVRVLMTVGRGNDPEALGTLPRNVHVERWWPQAEVMPHAALTVGHGGWGTTLATLAAGVPMVLLPLFALDQHYNADRVEAVGAGVTLAGGLDAIKRVPAAVQEVLGGAHTVSARLIRDEIVALDSTENFPGTLSDLT
jgi:UDP:flavonoid glycosyltransferase YjiC (YdhE family)